VRNGQEITDKCAKGNELANTAQIFSSIFKIYLAEQYKGSHLYGGWHVEEDSSLGIT
jgi:hypothetical protein